MKTNTIYQIVIACIFASSLFNLANAIKNVRLLNEARVAESQALDLAESNLELAHDCMETLVTCSQVVDDCIAFSEIAL